MFMYAKALLLHDGQPHWLAQKMTSLGRGSLGQSLLRIRRSTRGPSVSRLNASLSLTVRRQFADSVSSSVQDLPKVPPVHRPTKKTFSGGDDGQSGIAATIAAFFGGFAATVLALSLTSEAQAPTRLLPNKYDMLQVLDSQRCTSPSDPLHHDDGTFVYLTVQAPHYIAPPRLLPEHLQLAASGKPIWRIVSLYMKEPTLQIERPYTPLYADAITGPRGQRAIELLIKRYPDGEVGRYAHRLQQRQGVELRGPEVSWQGPQTNHLILMVGGTGITPAYQLITSILGHPDRPFPPGGIPRISLLYAAEDPSSLLLLPELNKLQQAYGKMLNVRLFCEHDDARSAVGWTDWLLRKTKHVGGFPIQRGRINDSAVKETLDKHTSDSRHILVCGPDGMIDSLAGPKVGKKQGELGGMLQRVGCKEDEVWKL